MLSVFLLVALIITVWLFYPFLIISLSKRVLPKSWRERLTNRFAANQNLQKEYNYLKNIESDK